MLGHDRLMAAAYQHRWGVGKHVLGSQVFDYWQDPWGRVHEHWADSDTLNSDYGSRLVPAHEGFQSQWGEPVPEAFIGHVSK